MSSRPDMTAPAQNDEKLSCSLCGRKDVPVAEALGVCVQCIRSKVTGSLEIAHHSHAKSRKMFGLPDGPPNGEGIHCKICSQHCRIGEGELSYCGLRWNENGKILALSSPYEGLFQTFPELPIRDCCTTSLSPDSPEGGYPSDAGTNGLERGSVNLGIFLYGCNFDCLFCRHPLHKQFHANMVRPVDDLIHMTLQNREISCWRFLGGSPEPQLPFAINASQKILAALKGERILRICFEWNGCGYPDLVNKAAGIAFGSGGSVKFDLKAWEENVHVALTGVSNKVVYENFAMVARAFPKSADHSPWLWATTVLVPGYVDEVEVANITKFLADIDPLIPYHLLVFHPDYMMCDLPTTPVDQVRACYRIAKQHLQHVHVGNLHLLGLSNEQVLA